MRRGRLARQSCGQVSLICQRADQVTPFRRAESGRQFLHGKRSVRLPRDYGPVGRQSVVNVSQITELCAVQRSRRQERQLQDGITTELNFFGW